MRENRAATGNYRSSHRFHLCDIYTRDILRRDRKSHRRLLHFQRHYPGPYSAERSEAGSSYWDPNLFLSSTFGFGHFSFAAAKGIDVVWDFVVGRFGQIVLAFMAYLVLRRSLSTYMEEQEMHIPVYASLAFDKTSLAALWATSCDLFGSLKPSWKPTAAFRGLNWRYVGYSIVLVYVLGFPTMVSVMTGTYADGFTPYQQQKPKFHHLTTSMN